MLGLPFQKGKAANLKSALKRALLKSRPNLPEDFGLYIAMCQGHVRVKRSIGPFGIQLQLLFQCLFELNLQAQ